jgi:hypothetical protein
VIDGKITFIRHIGGQSLAMYCVFGVLKGVNGCCGVSVKKIRTNCLPPKSKRYLCKFCIYIYIYICTTLHAVTPTMMAILAVSYVRATLTECVVIFCMRVYNCGVKINNIEHNYVCREWRV